MDLTLACASGMDPIGPKAESKMRKSDVAPSNITSLKNSPSASQKTPRTPILSDELNEPIQIDRLATGLAASPETRKFLLPIEQERKLVLLAKLYGFDPSIDAQWKFVSLELARHFVPGFSEKIIIKNRGRHKTEIEHAKVCLYIEREINNSKFKISQCSSNLTKKGRELHRMKPETVRRIYYKYKNDTVIRALMIAIDVLGGTPDSLQK